MIDRKLVRPLQPSQTIFVTVLPKDLEDVTINHALALTMPILNLYEEVL